MNLFRRPSLLFVLALLFFAAGTWSLPLIDRDEPRFAEASREMRERGDFIVPYLNNQYRFDKPPLTYWAQVASFTIFGENDFSARFPSVLTAALTVLAIYGFGSRLFNANTGWFAALIFMTCLQVSMHAKGAVADMIMVFFYTITVWAAWEMIAALGKSTSAVSASAQRRWWWAFYAALALGFLAKGPVAWFPLLAIAIYAWMYRPEGLARKFKFTIGMVLVLAAVGAWGVEWFGFHVVVSVGSNKVQARLRAGLELDCFCCAAYSCMTRSRMFERNWPKAGSSCRRSSRG